MSYAPRTFDADSVAVVTGGAGGIGAATSRLLHGRGARVAIFDVNVTAGQSLLKELIGTNPGSPPRALFFECDVSSPPSVAAAFAGVAAIWGPRCDVLVTLAAVFTFKAAHLATNDDWDRVLAGAHQLAVVDVARCAGATRA